MLPYYHFEIIFSKFLANICVNSEDSKIEVNFQLRSIPNCCLPQHYLQYPARLNEKCVTIWHYQMCEPNRTPYLVLFLLRKHVAFYIPLRNKCHNFNSWIKIAWYCFRFLNQILCEVTGYLRWSTPVYTWNKTAYITTTPFISHLCPILYEWDIFNGTKNYDRYEDTRIGVRNQVFHLYWDWLLVCSIDFLNE